MSRLLLVPVMVMTAVAPVGTLAARQTKADTARVLYHVAEDLRLRGRDDDAERLFSLIRERYPHTEFARLAADVVDDLGEFRHGRSGRTELVAWSTLYGAALGLMIPAALGADSPEPFGAGLLIGGPAGFGLSKAWSDRTSISSGQARAMTFGSWWGTWQGFGWRDVFDIGDGTQTVCPSQDECFTYADESERAPFTAMVVGGLSGMALGTVLGRSRPISSSSALVTNFGAMWGTWFGAVLGELAKSDEYREDDDTQLAFTLVGGNVGLLAGALGAPALGWSTGQAWSVHLAGIAGLVAGLGMDLLFEVDDSKAALAVPGMTSAVALLAAAATISRNSTGIGEPGSMQAAMVDLDGGQVRLGIPMPVPTMIPVLEPGKRRFTPAARVSLLRWVL